MRGTLRPRASTPPHAVKRQSRHNAHDAHHRNGSGRQSDPSSSAAGSRDAAGAIGTIGVAGAFGTTARIGTTPDLRMSAASVRILAIRINAIRINAIRRKAILISSTIPRHIAPLPASTPFSITVQHYRAVHRIIHRITTSMGDTPTSVTDCGHHANVYSCFSACESCQLAPLAQLVRAADS